MDHEIRSGGLGIHPADPRVLMAAERTLLAWTRTCLTVMTLGFVVARFHLSEGLYVGAADAGGRGQATSSLMIGCALILLGAVFEVITAMRYVRFLRRPERQAAVAQGHWLPEVVLAVILAVLGFGMVFRILLTI